MHNIALITSREYLSRVKKRSFIIMTLLAPVLIASFYGGIIWVSMNEYVGAADKTIAVVDSSGLFKNKLDAQQNISFVFKDHFDRSTLLEGKVDGYLSIPGNYNITTPLTLQYESRGSLSVKENELIRAAFVDKIQDMKLENMGINKTSIDSLKSVVSISELKIDGEGRAKSSNIAINTALGIGLAVMIYFFIFLYGVQVMRGVIEEKTNRIVELMVSSVKPFELMMGKVIGIAAVGLTQLGIWALLTGLLTLIISAVFGIQTSELQNMDPAMGAPLQGEAAGLINAVFDLPLGKIFSLFIFFFIGGYLLYGALFAAIGSAVDSETDTQQFMMPVTLPLVFSFVISFSVVLNDPNGSLATWLSIIPFSSPIVMMVRLPFDPPAWQIALSMLSIAITILAVIWMAAKIYRTGILMYGKKPGYKEILKWLFYKN